MSELVQKMYGVKRAVVRQAWQLQAVLDVEYSRRENGLVGSDVGPWKITRVLDAHLEAATVLKAVRRCGDALQERAVMQNNKRQNKTTNDQTKQNDKTKRQNKTTDHVSKRAHAAVSASLPGA